MSRYYCTLCDEIYPEHECPIGRAGLDLCPKCEEPVTPYIEPELNFSSSVTGQPTFMPSIPTSDEERGVITVPDYVPGFFMRKQAGG